MGLSFSHQGLPQGYDKGDLLGLLDGLGKQGLSVSATAFKLLRYYVWRSRKEDYRAGRICGLWEKVCDVATHIDLSSRAINGAERELEAAGYIQRTRGGNGARYGRRHGGAIVSMAGISLAPLIGRYDDLTASLEARMLHRQAMELCRTEIHHLRRLIRDHGDADLCVQSDDVARHGRVSRIGRQEHLEEIRDALKAVYALISGMSGAPKTSDASEENCSPCLQQNESRECSRQPEPARPAISLGQIMRLASDPYHGVLTALGGASPANFIEASARIASTISITLSAWSRACTMLGRERAALCVLVIDRNARRADNDPYKVHSPAACLNGMVQRAHEGELHLERLLWASQKAIGAEDAPLSLVLPTRPARAPSLGLFAAGVMKRLSSSLPEDEA